MGAAVALFALVVLLLAAFASPVRAQAAGGATPNFEEFGPFLVDPDRPDVIILNGVIGDTTLLDFRRAARAYPDARVMVLNSDGGRVATGLAIADELHDDGFATVVPSWAGCYSACAFIFLAGVERAALGELGVHQFYSETATANTAQATVADILDILARFGTSSDLISVMLRTPPNDIHVLSARELERFGVNVGFADGMDEFEFAAVADQLILRSETGVAGATLFLHPDDWQTIEGTVDWRVRDDDGDTVVTAHIAIGEDEIAFDLALAQVFDPERPGGLLLLVAIDDPDFALTDPDPGRILVTREHPSDDGRHTSFTLLPREGDDGSFSLVSQRRWAMLDLRLLADAVVIEIALVDGNGDPAILQIQTTNILPTVIDEWMELAADLPLGDVVAEEAPQPAAITIGDAAATEEGTATWYATGTRLAARIFFADPDTWVDVSLNQRYVDVWIEQPQAFAAEPVIGLSPFGDLEWARLDEGVYRAQLSSQAASRLAVTLARADAFELELVRDDDEHIRIVIATGDRFDAMLDAVLDAWENAPPEDTTPAAAPPATSPTNIPANRTPAGTADAGPFIDLGFYRDWGATRNDEVCVAFTLAASATPANGNIRDTFFTIYIAPGQRSGVPSFIFDFEPNSEYFVTARIDGRSTFDFDPDTHFAHLSSTTDPAAMIQALQNGVSMEVVSVTGAGQTRTERYSLLGMTAALAAAVAACR